LASTRCHLGQSQLEAGCGWEKNSLNVERERGNRQDKLLRLNNIENICLAPSWEQAQISNYTLETSPKKGDPATTNICKRLYRKTSPKWLKISGLGNTVSYENNCFLRFCEKHPRLVELINTDWLINLNIPN